MVPGAAEMQLTIAQLIQDLFKKSKTLFALIRTFGLFHLGGNAEEKLWKLKISHEYYPIIFF